MDSSSNQHRLEYRGYLKGKGSVGRLTLGVGHGGWVTSMQVGEETTGTETKEFLISGSRDKTVIIWDIVEKKETDEDKEWGYTRKVLKGALFLSLDNLLIIKIGHSHFI